MSGATGFRAPDLERLKRMPEFSALQQVCAALLPLDPEGRRKVIEALHALLPVSAGKSGEDKRPKKR